MKSLSALLILSIVACGAPEPEVRPPASEPRPRAAAEPAETAQTTKPAEREIYIDGVSASNPIVVTGRARTFENNVVLRARDASDRLIVETFTTSAGEMGNHNPFEAQLWVTRDPGPRVTIEALEYSAKDGSPRSLTKKTTAYSVEPVEMTLMFPAGDCTRIEPFARRIPKSKSMARLLIEALIAGPTDAEKSKGASAAFPQGSQVRSVNLRDGVLTVDFNERLQNVGGSCAAQAIRDSVTKTLQRLPSVKNVVITAGGSEALALQP